MSTGADCSFREQTPGQWFYDLQCWPYGETPDHDTFGPFTTEEVAHTHLSDNHGNPGGYFTTTFNDRIRRAFDRLPTGAITTGNKVTVADDVGKLLKVEVTYQQLVAALDEFKEKTP